MSTILSKPGVRILGVAESAPPRAITTILTGVVMRADCIIDSVVWRKATIGKMDATNAVIELVQDVARQDLGCVLLHGSVIAGYNVIDMQRLHNATALPIISVSREPVEDIKQHLIHTFPTDWQRRWEIIQRNGGIVPLSLPTGTTAHLQFKGIDSDIAGTLVKRVTRFGGLPEPIRVARLFARSLSKQK